jgi:hypothetical protein
MESTKTDLSTTTSHINNVLSLNYFLYQFQVAFKLLNKNHMINRQSHYTNTGGAL